MAPIARILVAMGHAVSGSDQSWSSRLAELERLGVAIRTGHDGAHVAGAELVVASAAIPTTNPELVAAAEAGVPVVRRRAALAALCALRRTVAVAGTHGKTTTTAMLVAVLTEAGLSPSFLVGGDLVGGAPSAAWRDGEWFVVEADESDGTFLDLGAECVVLTSVEPDHLDHHGSVEALRAAFTRFLVQASGPRVVCSDDPGAAAVADGTPHLSYGTGPQARFALRDVDLTGAGAAFTLVDGGTELGRLHVAMPGVHNARNAAGATVAALALGAPFTAAARGLGAFAGVARRFEWRGGVGGVSFVDSYDHLPGEVAAAVAAARHGDWKRIVCVFQPHRFTRTAALWQDFAYAFDGADVVAVTDVYAAGQEPIPGVTGKLVVDAVLDAAPGRRVAWLPRRRDVLSWLEAELRPGDLCLTLGAGDLTTVPDEAMALLERRAMAGPRGR